MVILADCVVFAWRAVADIVNAAQRLGIVEALEGNNWTASINELDLDDISASDKIK